MKGVKRSAPGEVSSIKGNGHEDLLKAQHHSDDAELRSDPEVSAGVKISGHESKRTEGARKADNEGAGDDTQATIGSSNPDANPTEDVQAHQKKQKLEQQNDVPLVIPSAICKDTKASLLVHLRDEALDFSGDTGAVGRIAVGAKKKSRGLTFDLKGQQFTGQIVPSATVLVVGVGRTEAKVEGIFSEVCRLDYKRNVLDSMGGEVLKGEMDDSYKYEEEDVNVRGAGDGGRGGEADDAQAGGAGAGGKLPKGGRKKPVAKKKAGAKGASSASAKKGASKSKR